MRFCDEGGLLVGADDAVGAPEDARWSRFAPRFGCANLRCSRCGEAVHNEVNDAWRRTWRCACTTYTTATGGPAPNPEPDAPYDASLPWSCAGHADRTDIDAQTVLDGLDDLTSVPPPLRRWPGFAAAHRCDAAGAGRASLLQRLADVALSDEASAVRVSRAVHALTYFPLDPAAGRLAGAPPERWSRPDPDCPGRPLAWTVAQAFGPRLDPARGDTAAAAALQALAVRPPGVDFVLFPAVWADPAWAVSNTEAITDAAPDAWRSLLQALKGRPDDAVAVAARLVAHGVPRAEIAALAQRWPGVAAQRVIAAVGG